MSKWLAIILVVIFIGLHIGQEVVGFYEYQNSIGSYWDLSDRASTLDQKSIYLDKYVAALETSNLSGNDALFMFTPENSYDQNMVALKSLQTRMHEIQHMDVQSFQYQQAISQITAQEQGDAGAMLGHFQGLWFKHNHFFLWGDIDFMRWLIEIIGGFLLVVFAFADDF